MNCSPPGASVHGDSPGRNTGVGCHALLQWIFLTQRWNPGLPHCGQILYRLSHQGSPGILEWVAYPSFRELPDPGIKLGSPALQADQLSYWGSPLVGLVRVKYLLWLCELRPGQGRMEPWCWYGSWTHWLGRDCEQWTILIEFTPQVVYMFEFHCTISLNLLSYIPFFPSCLPPVGFVQRSPLILFLPQYSSSWNVMALNT